MTDFAHFPRPGENYPHVRVCSVHCAVKVPKQVKIYQSRFERVISCFNQHYPEVALSYRFVGWFAKF